MASDHDFGNQFTNYGGEERARHFFSDEKRDREFDQVRRILEENPTHCLVPSYKRRTFRDGKSMIKASYRALAYFDRHGTVPEHGFGVASCGTTGCINPDHQVPVENGPMKVGGFVIVRPKNSTHAEA